MIYLDNAASSHPKPSSVLHAVSEHLRRNGANPGRSGHRLSLEASETVYGTRKMLADFFGTEPENVLFTWNTTAAINQALNGILQPGDHVIISDLEHNSVLRPLKELERSGIQFDVAETFGDDERTVESFRAKIKPETRMIFCTHASNVTGQILPVVRLGEICREHGILMGVDGAQTAGIELLSLKADPIDLLCVPGHKGLLGPQGTGALILAKQIPMRPILSGGTGTDSLSEVQPATYPEGFESGTLNTPGIAGLRAAVRYVSEHSSEIRARERFLRDLFLEEMRNVKGYRILGEGTVFVSTIAVCPEKGGSEAVTEYLNRNGICVRGGFHCSALAHRKLGTAETGAVRVSFGYRNTPQDVWECVKCLKKYQNN